MRLRARRLFFGVLLFFVVLAAGPAFAGAPAGGFSLTIAHINDTHSHLEPALTRLTLDGRQVAARLGGFARLKTALDAARKEARAEGSRFLALHAGDAVQGTLFFNVFRGRADFDFLNLLGLDAMTLGNHEFDHGPGRTARLVARAKFPVVSANVDASAVPALAARLRPYVVEDLDGVRVGVVGATTPTTANISSPGRVRFLPAAPAVERAVRAARAKGARAVVLLSHLGYAEDVALARRVPGIAVIVGGHSHTLLGDPARLAPLGLEPAGPYPTEVRGPDGERVLVVQAWCWGMELGLLRVDFDARGRVVGFAARPELLAGGGFVLDGRDVPAGSPDDVAFTRALAAGGAAQVVAEDPEVLRRLAPLSARLDVFRKAAIGATATVDLVRRTATDPGPLVAEALLSAAPGAQAALVMPGNVRADVFRGPITRAAVLEVLPFGNTLATVDVSGAQLKSVLEDAAAFSLAKFGPEARSALFYAAGLSCRIDLAAPRGRRVSDLRVAGKDGRLVPVNLSAAYRLATNAYLAGGGDGLATLAAIGRPADTGLLCSDVFADYLQRLKVVRPPAQDRVIVAPARPLTLLRRPERGLALAA